MRNLKNVFLKEISIPETLRLTATAWDATDDSIICAFGPTEASSTITLKRRFHNASTLDSGFKSIASWDAPCPLSTLSSDEIICIQYFSDSATTCLILAGGDLLVIREDAQHGEEIVEIVGSVDAGIAAAAWAPDEELLAIATRADTLILMTRHFEPVTDVTLTAEDLKASKHVSVGWGKKETQFHGKRAKALRDPTVPESVDEGRMSNFDDGRTTISWRGDGAFLAVNRVVPDGRRVIRVFTRDGTMESASEPVDGLESALSWRPVGNLVAGIQRLEDRLDVVFFERNGLRHGEFSLRLSKVEMDTWASNVSLNWNVDSTVLAVSFRDRVQLWTVGNYHYYLKQEILFEGEATSSSSSCTSWHPEKPLRICVHSKGTMIDLEYLLCIDRGSTFIPHDDGIVAVIDGRSLKLTPLKHAMVPPPISFTELATSENIIDCSISLAGNIITILTALSIEVYEWDFGSKPATAPTRTAKSCSTFRGEVGSSTRLRQVVVRDQGVINLLSNTTSHGSKITSYVIDDSTHLLKEADIGLPAIDSDQGGFIRNICTDANHGFLWCQTETHLNCLDQPRLSSSLSTVQSWCEIVVIKAKEEHSSAVDGYTLEVIEQLPVQAHIFSLSKKGDLFANGKLLTRGCTSFVSTNAHLILTTSRHLLKFVHLDSPDGRSESCHLGPAADTDTGYEVPGDTPEADERCRRIERGGKLVTVIPSMYAVILQMPRGNLETIYPRALVLAGVRQHLDEKDFRAAFLACQNHQVDMNIICDYRPDLFMSNISLFIKQVRQVSRIDLFLSKLSEENVSETLYKNTLSKCAAHDSAQGNVMLRGHGQLNGTETRIAHTNQGGKVNRICDAFLSCLKPTMSKYIQNIITAHVCKSPPDLVPALELVASLRAGDANRAEEAISHLCFLSDSNRLYDAALSMYDLPLTLLVAQQAQRDPREYMPFLQSLNKLPQLRRHFRIDDHLRNYAKALMSLHALAAHEEVEAYTIKHALYTQALKLYRYDPDHLTSMTRLHATYLTSQSKHLASAVASESLCDYALASSSYAKCSPPRWREALHCASLVQPALPTQQIRSLALQLATSLREEQRDYRSASQIYTDYLHDIPAATSVLCRGSYFAESLRLLSLRDLGVQIPVIVDTALGEKFGEIIELMADCRSQLHAQVPRIQELRVKKAEDPLAFFGGDPTMADVDGMGDIPDNISLAPTDASTMGGQSLFTRYTGYKSAMGRFAGTVASSNMSRKTSKTRRKEERKRARGKKGSVYEEEYLVGSLKRLIERVNGVHAEVGRLVEGLRRRAMRDRAENVELLMQEMVKECEWAKREVWVEEQQEEEEEEKEELKEAGGDVGVDGQYHGKFGDGKTNGIASKPRGADAVPWESQIEEQQYEGKAAPEVKTWQGLEY